MFRSPPSENAGKAPAAAGPATQISPISFHRFDAYLTLSLSKVLTSACRKVSASLYRARRDAQGRPLTFVEYLLPRVTLTR
jgi:hypothetical protein